MHSHIANSRISLRCVWLVVALAAAGSLAPEAKADGFDGPSFRKGMWHFVRTIDVLMPSKFRHRVLAQEMTRCVDPTHAMKGTFSPLAVGNCVSARPERSENRYTFANRCDYLGPVSTVITVHSDESYTEINDLSLGELPKQELVVAHRVGDCEEEGGDAGRQPLLSH
jgi:hypothetical protein